MIIKSLVFVVPLFVQPAKKKYHINLNQYRNWHYQVSNMVKKEYLNQVKNQIENIKFNSKISLIFTLYKGSARKMDRANILSIHEKFFCDALVHCGCIEDDNDDYITSTHYYSGGIDKDNPRVQIEVQYES